MADLQNIPCRNEEGAYLVVIETPRSSLVKLKYVPELGAMVFGRPLPLGVAYPYDWGFFPSTRADDGDPLDAMVLFDCATCPGVVIPSVPIGIVKLTQRETQGERVRNDRVICVPAADPRYGHVRELPVRVREELEHFFVAATFLSKKAVAIQGWSGPKAARAAIERAGARYQKRGQSE